MLFLVSTLNIAYVLDPMTSPLVKLKADASVEENVTFEIKKKKAD